jgi:hypothetical protein
MYSYKMENAMQLILLAVTALSLTTRVRSVHLIQREETVYRLDKIVLLGDSITQVNCNFHHLTNFVLANTLSLQFAFKPETFGYGAFISDSFVRKYDVLDRGFAGNRFRVLRLYFYRVCITYQK